MKRELKVLLKLLLFFASMPIVLALSLYGIVEVLGGEDGEPTVFKFTSKITNL